MTRLHQYFPSDIALRLEMSLGKWLVSLTLDCKVGLVSSSVLKAVTSSLLDLQLIHRPLSHRVVRKETAAPAPLQLRALEAKLCKELELR